MFDFSREKENIGNINSILEGTTEWLFSEGAHAVGTPSDRGNLFHDSLFVVNLPYNLYNDKWLAAMIRKNVGNHNIPEDIILDFVKNSSFLKCCRKDCEERIAYHQTACAILDEDYENFILSQYGEYDYDLGLKKFVADSLTEIGIRSRDSIKQGIEKGIKQWVNPDPFKSTLKTKKHVKTMGVYISLDELNSDL